MAIMQIDCMKRKHGTPELRVGVDYWLKDKIWDGDRYGLNLVDSAGSGRPASYDLGSGPISTAQFHERTDADPYEAAIWQFVEDLALGKATDIDVAWVIDGRGEAFEASFGTNGVAEAAQTMLDYCPRTTAGN